MFLNLYKNSETVRRPRLVSVLTIVGHEPNPEKEGYIYVYMADGTRVSVPYSVEAFSQDVEMAARSFFQSCFPRGVQQEPEPAAKQPTTRRNSTGKLTPRTSPSGGGTPAAAQDANPLSSQ